MLVVIGTSCCSWRLTLLLPKPPTLPFEPRIAAHAPHLLIISVLQPPRNQKLKLLCSAKLIRVNSKTMSDLRGLTDFGPPGRSGPLAKHGALTALGGRRPSPLPVWEKVLVRTIYSYTEP